MRIYEDDIEERLRMNYVERMKEKEQGKRKKEECYS